MKNPFTLRPLISTKLVASGILAPLFFLFFSFSCSMAQNRGVGDPLYDAQYRFITLGQEGTQLNGQDVAGSVKVVQKVNSSTYLVSFEFQGNMSMYYLKNSKKLDAVDNQSVFILATVAGTKSYKTLLGLTNTVIVLKLKKFTFDGKKGFSAN